MQILMSSRRTIMDGEVVTFAAEFREGRDALGPTYKALGPFEVSASRDAVLVHHAVCRTEEAIDDLVTAIKHATNAMNALSRNQRGGAPSRYPSKPTPVPAPEVQA